MIALAEVGFEFSFLQAGKMKFENNMKAISKYKSFFGFLFLKTCIGATMCRSEDYSIVAAEAICLRFGQKFEDITIL